MASTVENDNTRTAHEFPMKLLNDTDVTQEKFISQNISQDETWIHHFDYVSEKQSMQWNERISQHCHFITPCNSTFHVIRKQPATGKVNKIVRSRLCGGCGLLCCFSVSAMAQWCGSTLVTDDSRLFTLSVDLRL